MNPDYESLLPLAVDDRYELLRGRRARTGAAVLVKRARRDNPSAGEQAALQREFGILAGLSSAATLLPRWIESPAPAVLVMEDPGGQLLSARVASARLSLDAVLALGIQVASLLAELHGRGFLHNGVRPEGILFSESEQRAWLIDFGQAGLPAARLPGGADAARLVYVSPEQTGRMDRVADARSDLYALGIVLYELLVGAPPFRSDDALAQIHWHIAGTPRAPAELDPGIPALLSDLVMKLLAKTPDERYQSASGLAQDLAVCARDWSTRRRIAPFPLGRRDIGEHLVISARLYGREREVRCLLDAFEQTCLGRGGGAMWLVEGYSGIGKTSLIQQLYRPIVQQKGYFISGKFDQVVRGVPFGALIQAFRGLVRQWLTEDEQQLARWREILATALGGNGGVLAEVMPEIEFIVGPQPAPTALGSTEAQNRFQRVLQNFVAALAQPEHPLVLFLDDLQWADAATLDLLEPLLTRPDIRCLMLMGAFRDHELDASPRLARTLAALSGAGVALPRLPLGPLELPDLQQLIADSLHGSLEHAAPLARLVHDKTGGNPFFVIQFLRSLEREGHLTFDDAQTRWVYRIEQIADAPLADNVIDLMSRSIQRLPPKSQYALTLAACIGNRFDRQTLAIVSEQSAAATAHDLEHAVAEGLLTLTGGSFSDESLTGDVEATTFAFLHDRVQQSAYALIPAERRQMVHLMVGRLLRSRASPEQLESGLFDVVHHLNLGRTLIRDGDERQQVAALNLAAGRRAKSATAHDTAHELFRAGIELLDDAAWQTQYTLCFELHLEAAESQSLCGRFDAALRELDELLARACTPVDRTRVARLRSVQYENMARYADAVASARDGLAPFGVSLPEAETEKARALEHEIAAIEVLRGGREIAALIELPGMRDPQVKIVMDLLTVVWSAAYLVGDPTLARLISATLVRLSLEHGNAEESAYGYVTHAITVGPVRGDYAAAYAFGQLALAVNQRFDDQRRRAKICQQFHAHVALWCQPFRDCVPYAREACRSGLASGDFLYAAYGAATEPWVALLASQDLAQFVVDYTPSVALIDQLKNTGFADSVRLLLNWARALQGRTTGPLSLSDASFDEAVYVQRYATHPLLATIHAVARLQLCTLLGSAAQALQAAQHAQSLVQQVPGTVWPVLHEFWCGLALAAGFADADEVQRRDWLSQLEGARAGFQARATHNAENFACQALLLGGEIARLQGDEREAIRHYEEAIEFAAVAPLLPYEALAHELTARLRVQRAEHRLAGMHMVRAAELYRRWGAGAKAQALERAWPALFGRVGVPVIETAAAPDGVAPAWPQTAATPGDTDGLDLMSVLKAAQAIAGEVELESLLARLMHIAVENAGAERGALVLESEDGPLVHATDGAPDGLGGVALARSTSVPVGIVNYVRRTTQTVVLANAESDEHHGRDPYVLRHRLRSVLCTPIHKLGRLIGVLYLEHRRVGAVFTPQRLHTLGILATQAAISLENAQLFAGLKQEIGQRQQAQERLAAALGEVGRLKDDLEAENSYLRRDLIVNVSHDLRTPLVSMRGYLEVLATQGTGLSADQRAQYLGIALRQSERLAHLIDELFELAKLDFKGLTLERENFPFGELAADVVQKFQLAAQERQIDLGVDSAPRLPFVEADLSLMERVLENLIGNALRHTPAGGRVRVCLEVEGDRLLAQVVDTGCGIERTELPFIFDRFYRGANGRRHQPEGAGLGLAITKRILDLHHSEIRVESDPQAGTRFSFRLPLQNGARVAGAQ